MNQDTQMAVSLRLPEDVKKRIAKLAKAHDMTPHRFMIEAIREKLEAEEVQAAFHADARRRLARMKKSGVGIPAEEVFEYLKRRAEGKAAERPEPRKIP
jgi:predicted transcriptional regulator